VPVENWHALLSPGRLKEIDPVNFSLKRKNYEAMGFAVIEPVQMAHLASMLLFHPSFV
jgi:hypothetical protein